MSKGQKITVGCLGTLIVLILVGYFSLQWAKRKIVTVAAEAAKVEIVSKIKNSPLPEDQKEAFIIATDEILSKMSSGEIEFTLNASFADKPKATAIISNALQSAVNKLNIDEEEKKSINSQIERFAKAYSENKIVDEEVLNISEKLAQGQFGVMMAIWAAEAKYIHPSGLSKEEKDQAHITLGRLSKGKKEEKITNAELNKLVDPYSVTDPDGNRTLKDSLTDKEIKEFLTTANELLTKNKVSEEPLKLHIGHELKEALDAAQVPE